MGLVCQALLLDKGILKELVGKFPVGTRRSVPTSCSVEVIPEGTYQGILYKTPIPSTPPPVWITELSPAKRTPKEERIWFSPRSSLWLGVVGGSPAEREDRWLTGVFKTSCTLIFFTYAGISFHPFFLLDFPFLEMRRDAHNIPCLRRFRLNKKLPMRELFWQSENNSPCF